MSAGGLRCYCVAVLDVNGGICFVAILEVLEHWREREIGVVSRIEKQVSAADLSYL